MNRLASFPLESFLNVRAASAPSFSPDGRHLAFLTNITGVTQVWQVSVEGGWPTQLTFHRESVRGVHYSPTRHELLYTMDAGGDEKTQLFLLRGVAGNTEHGLGDGWESVPLCPDPKAVHSFGGWSRDGKLVAFSANRDDPSRFDIHVLKIGEKEPRLVQKGPGGYYSSAGFSPDDASLLVFRMESNFNHDLYVVEVATGKARHLTPHEGDAQYEGAAWSHDGKHVYCVSTHGGRDLAGLARIEVATGKIEFVATPEHEVEAVAVSPKGRWLAWVENHDGAAELVVVGQGGEKGQSRHANGGLMAGLEFAPDDSRLAYVGETAVANPDVHLLTWQAAGGPKVADRQVTQSSRAGLPFGEFVKPELVRYKSFDGLEVPAWWYRPRGGQGPVPVIVYPHGGPESQTRPGFSALFQYFVSRGYGVFAPNVRGSSGYGTKYMNLDNVRKRMDSVADLTHGAYWLRDSKQGDAKRLAVYGGSYGGFMVLASVTNYPDLWAAGIDVVGICNFVTFLEKTGAYRRAHREKEYGSLEKDREFLQSISPIHKVDRIKCPMMVIHGANDPRVPVDEAEQIVAALKKRMVPVEYLRYEDEGHGLVKLKNRLDAYPKMVAFLDRYVKAPAR
jgi:dipeptidyl aminopeptidase/acylaminoacyl peptidase